MKSKDVTSSEPAYRCTDHAVEPQHRGGASRNVHTVPVRPAEELVSLGRRVRPREENRGVVDSARTGSSSK